MKGIWAVPIISSILILGALGFSQDVFADCYGCGDFNNDGYDDLAVGLYGEDVGAVVDAGAVHVIYGSASGLHRNLALPDQLWTQESLGIEDVAETGDNFGYSLTAGDFNNDGYDDLAVGVYFETVAAGSDGAANVIYGSASGLHRNLAQTDQFRTQDSAGINDVAEIGDRFGYSLTAGDFNNDMFDDLAVGVVQEGVGAAGIAGAVNAIYGSASGLHQYLALPDQFWNQDSLGIEDVAEAFDSFGFSLPT